MNASNLNRVFLSPSYVGGDGVTYRRGRLVEVLADGTLVVQPAGYYTTIDCRPEEVRFEEPLPIREKD